MKNSNEVENAIKIFEREMEPFSAIGRTFCIFIFYSFSMPCGKAWMSWVYVDLIWAGIYLVVACL